MLTLVEFLLARIAEDEAVARGTCDPNRPGIHWQWAVPDDGGDPDAPRWLRTTEEFPTTSGVGALPAFPLGFEFMAEPARGMAHIARHDPARVLAECEAKRHVVEYCVIASDDGLDADAWTIAKAILRHLALPYADHPDYDESWKP